MAILRFYLKKINVHRINSTCPPFYPPQWGGKDTRHGRCLLSEQADFKVKKTVVHTGRRLSLQRHQHRHEHWFIIKGQARVTLNGRTLEFSPGQSIDIPHESLHRIENIGSDDVVFIEVQTGDYFGEDDIERLEDDFGRVG